MSFLGMSRIEPRNNGLGPVYGVPLWGHLPAGGMNQAMPDRKELIRVREISERTVAGFEVLTSHLQDSLNEIKRLLDAILNSGYDISPCRTCGVDVLTVPDGLTTCDECAKKEMEEQ